MKETAENILTALGSVCNLLIQQLRENFVNLIFCKTVHFQYISFFEFAPPLCSNQRLELHSFSSALMFSPGALSVSVRFLCWSRVLVHIMLSHRDGVLVQRKGSHYLIMLLILGTRKRCLETFGPDSNCWSGTRSALYSHGWGRGDFSTWASSKKQFTTYTVQLQKCLIRVRHQTWMIPYEIATYCLL